MSDLSTMTGADWTVVAVAAAVLAASVLDLLCPRVWDLLRAAWFGRGVYGWQDWLNAQDRASMLRDWQIERRIRARLKGEG